MDQSTYDVLALGNAIVDIIASVGEDVLLGEGLPKGSMTLIEAERALRLSERLKGAVEESGGSAANTAVGVASLGGRAAFIGKVKADASGRAFARSLRKADVHFETRPSEDGPPTAQCHVLVTPDGERTMATYLGASQNLTAFDVARRLVESSAVTYLEGYLWDPPQAIEAFRLASQVAHEAGRKVALSLSDAFCVDRHRDDFLDMINLRRVDLVFANEHELKSLYQTGDLETALSAAAQAPAVFAVTRSADGCAVLDGGEREDIPAFHVDEVVDVTGAGDLFASGFLYGLSCGGLSLSDCGRLGCLAASEAITHFGARPQASLRTLARDRGLLS